jgi:hypothetical protein
MIGIEIITRRFDQVLSDIENIFSCVPDKLFSKKINGYLIWKQFYHMLNSLERNFIDPNNYQYPEFHEDKLNSLDHESEKELNKKDLYDYFKKIKSKLNDYLLALDDSKILEKINFRNMDLTRMDFILSQFIHVSWHLGYLYCSMKTETDIMPEYTGLYKNF